MILAYIFGGFPVALCVIYGVIALVGWVVVKGSLTGPTRGQELWQWVLAPGALD